MISPDYAADPARDAEDDMQASARALLWTLLVGALTTLGLLFGAPWACARLLEMMP
jgi:hypothetical protein